MTCNKKKRLITGLLQVFLYTSVSGNAAAALGKETRLYVGKIQLVNPLKFC